MANVASRQAGNGKPVFGINFQQNSCKVVRYMLIRGSL